MPSAYGESVQGTPFGRYRLQSLLGRGGMGEVWRAYDTATKRIVAIKLLPMHLSHDGIFVQRFRREAEAAARLNNPHVIPIHNYGEIDNRLYVDMRLVEGRDLAEILTEGPLPPERAVHFVGQVAGALHAAHKIGLVHRDVKPSNILVDEDDFAYLIDFGIARGADQTRLTGTGAAIGSWHYMAPERLAAREADARADIYALACVLYECLTGHRPFPGDSVESQVAAHLTTPPPRPSASRPDVPVAFDAVIARGMAKRPEERYQTVTELSAAAQEAPTVPEAASTGRHTSTLPDDRVAAVPRIAAVDHPNAPQPYYTVVDYPDTPRPQRPPPSGRPRRRRGIGVLIGAAGLVIVTVAVIGIVASRSGAPPRPNPPSSPRSSVPASRQIALPFTGLHAPRGVAVDTAGNVYVSDIRNNRVVKLAAGATTQTELPFGSLYKPGFAVDRQAGFVAVGSAGDVYVATGATNQVLKLAAGADTPTELPFSGLKDPDGVAVDTAGSVYVADSGNNRVLKLVAGASTQAELPFTGLNGPCGVAVDTADNVYVTDCGNHRVLELSAEVGAVSELEDFRGLADLGVAVDRAGNVYVSDTSDGQHGRVLKLAKAGGGPTEVPFSGLTEPRGVAVDDAGDVYVADWYNDRVLKLPPN